MPTTCRSAAEEPMTVRSTYEDDIRSVLQRTGANAPEVDRLDRLITGMQHLEWRLARGGARAAAAR